MERAPDTDITGDPWLDLLGAIVGRAIKDARAGNKSAAAWLWEVAPEWAGPAIDGDRTERPRPREKARQGTNRPLERSTAIVEPCRERGHRNMNDYRPLHIRLEEQQKQQEEARTAHAQAQTEQNRTAWASILAEIEQRGRDMEAQQEERRVQEAAQELERQKEHARQSYITNGGDPVLFNGLWPKLQQELAQQKALEALGAVTGVKSDLVSQFVTQENTKKQQLAERRRLEALAQNGG